jgi:hypothetical protein
MSHPKTRQMKVLIINLRWPMCLKLSKDECRFLETTIRLTVIGWATITNSLDEIILGKVKSREKKYP